MTKNPNELTIENSVVILIDHQPWVAFSVHSCDPALVINNTAALAQASRDVGVPVVLTTVGAKGGILGSRPHLQGNHGGLSGRDANRLNVHARVVTSASPRGRRCHEAQEAHHGRSHHRGLLVPVGSRCTQ